MTGVVAAKLNPQATEGAVDILMKLYTAYTDGDADLVEINPLILKPTGEVHALDAKVSLDANATYEHPDYEQYDATQPRDEREEAAHAKGLQYVGLEGSVGVIANGAGLAMSTVDVVNQVGGKPANFLDIGGGANADVMAGALEVINNDPDVKSILINIFGGITRGEEVANGIIEAMKRVTIEAPIVIRLDGTNARRGPGPPAAPPERQADDGTDDARRGPPGRRAGPLSRGARQHEHLRRREHQGRLPGPDRLPGPLLRQPQQGVRHPGGGRHPSDQGRHRCGRRADLRFRGRRQGGDRRHRQLHLHSRSRRPGGGGWRRPRPAWSWSSSSPRASPPTTRPTSTTRSRPTSPPPGSSVPSCPGLISPGKANIGITAGHIAKPGGPVGIVSRSGTLTYQALYELKQKDIGVTTCVGIGGDPVPGTSFIDCLQAFQADPDTKAVMMIGEIGGSAEEEAAEYIKNEMTKPVASYIAGVTAPPGKKMGHAGAIVSGGKGTAAAKMEALRDAGALVGENPTEAGELMADIVSKL